MLERTDRIWKLTEWQGRQRKQNITQGFITGFGMKQT